jgi:hypothetical protein
VKTKAQLIKRWGDILEEIKNDIPRRYEFYKDPTRNYKGGFCSTLQSDYRDFAVLDYLLNQDITSFKENLRNGIPFRIELFTIYDNGEPMHLDASPVSMQTFKVLFDALASGDMELAKTFANYMGGRPEVEDEFDDEFILSMGYSLKYATENDLENLKLWLPRLKDYCYNPKYKMTEFIGYPLVLEALMERDLEKANAAFKVLIEGHKKKCKSFKGPNYGYYFHDSPDADLFVWGIGLANLCRHYGLNVQIDDPLIPEELLIPVVTGIIH